MSFIRNDSRSRSGHHTILITTYAYLTDKKMNNLMMRKYV